ncbi:LOW QUALITY PROTEIN: hypothetical protein ElyMa_001565600, partial [Elysia marginata]
KTNLDIPGIPAGPVVAAETVYDSTSQSAAAAALSSPIHSPTTGGTRELSAELLTLRAENLELRRLMAAWGVPGCTRVERREMGAGRGGEEDGESKGDPERMSTTTVTTVAAAAVSDSAEICNNRGANISSSSSPGPGVGRCETSATLPDPVGSFTSAGGEAAKEGDKNALLLLSSSRLSVEEEECCEEKSNLTQESTSTELLLVENKLDTGAREEDKKKGESEESCSIVNTDSTKLSDTAPTVEVSFSISCDIDNHNDKDPSLGGQSNKETAEGQDSDFLKYEKEEETENEAGGEENSPRKGKGEKEEDSTTERGKSHRKREDLEKTRDMEEEPKEEPSSGETQPDDTAIASASEPGEDKEEKRKADKGMKSKNSFDGKEKGGKPRPLSILERYPGGKSQVVTSGSESRMELVEKVFDMDDEIVFQYIKGMKKKKERNDDDDDDDDDNDDVVVVDDDDDDDDDG